MRAGAEVENLDVESQNTAPATGAATDAMPEFEAAKEVYMAKTGWGQKIASIAQVSQFLSGITTSMALMTIMAGFGKAFEAAMAVEGAQVGAAVAGAIGVTLGSTTVLAFLGIAAVVCTATIAMNYYSARVMQSSSLDICHVNSQANAKALVEELEKSQVRLVSAPKMEAHYEQNTRSDNRTWGEAVSAPSSLRSAREPLSAEQPMGWVERSAQAGAGRQIM